MTAPAEGGGAAPDGPGVQHEPAPDPSAPDTVAVEVDAPTPADGTAVQGAVVEHAAGPERPPRPQRQARKPEGPAPAPVVQKVRLRYTKRGRLRFISHRDFARAFERALRRAGVPVAFSAGFSPHPKISYIGAAPTGTASEAEYLELGLAGERDVARLRADLDAVLPPGLDVLEVVTARAGSSLPDRVEASRWRLRLPGVAPDEAAAAVTAFLAAEAVPVEKRTKGGLRMVDTRAAVVDVAVNADSTGAGPPCAILQLVVRHTTPAVRPDDVLAGLRAVATLVPPAPLEATRCAQGLLQDDGTLADPLEPDRGPLPRSGSSPQAT